jgi:hypothetical protein
MRMSQTRSRRSPGVVAVPLQQSGAKQLREFKAVLEASQFKPLRTELRNSSGDQEIPAYPKSPTQGISFWLPTIVLILVLRHI